MKNLNKTIITIMLLLVQIIPAEAQSLRDYIRSRAEGSDSLLIKGIAPSLSIIRQQYRLERGGEYFGKNNMAYYGECYTLAVKVSGATILQNRVITPWSDDTDFMRVKQSGKYKPARFWSYQRSLNESTYKSVDWEMDNRYTKPLDKDSLLYKNEDPVSDFGLDLDYTEGEKNGYMVWAYSTSNIQDSTMHINLRQSNLHLNTLTDSTDIIMTPNEAEKVIGGIFVTPVYKPGGLIRIILVGVASKSKENKWVLHLLTRKTAETENVEPLDDKKEKQKKKRDIESSSEEPTPVG